jgi:small-conductance mechanosensitive channel
MPKLALLDIAVAPAILNTSTSCILRAHLHAIVVLDVALDEIVLVTTISLTGTICIHATTSVFTIIGMFSVTLYHAVVTTLLYESENRLLPDFTLRGVPRAAVFKTGARALVIALVLAPKVVEIRIVLFLVQVVLDAIASSTCSI